MSVSKNLVRLSRQLSTPLLVAAALAAAGCDDSGFDLSEEDLAELADVLDGTSSMTGSDDAGSDEAGSDEAGSDEAGSDEGAPTVPEDDPASDLDGSFDDGSDSAASDEEDSSDDPRLGEEATAELAAFDAAATLAVLQTNDSGNFDIVMRATDGTELDRINSNLPFAQSLAHHQDGFFIVVSESRQILRVEADGSSMVLFDGREETVEVETDWGVNWVMVEPIWRVEDDCMGHIVVTAERLLLTLDSLGNVLHAVEGDNACFMDTTGVRFVAGAPDSCVAYDVPVLDVIPEELSSWVNRDTAPVSGTEVTPSGQIMGQDLSGRLWTGNFALRAVSAYGAAPTQVTGHINEFNHWDFSALEPASANSVFALFDNQDGSTVGVVDIDGNAQVLFSDDMNLIEDMVVMP